MLAPPDTPHRSGCVQLNFQAAVVFDRKCVGGVDDRGGSGLFDGGGTIELVAGAQRFALVHAVLDRIARETRVDLPGFERYGAGGAAFEGWEAGLVEGEDDGQAEVQELDVDFRGRVAVGALVGRVESGAKRRPITERFQRDRHRVLLAEVAEIDGAMQEWDAGAGKDRRDLTPHLLVSCFRPGGVGSLERDEHRADQIVSEIRRQHPPGREGRRRGTTTRGMPSSRAMATAWSGPPPP